MKESLDPILKNTESYLNMRSKRELILLFIFCFLIGFLLVFGLGFERAKQSLEDKKQMKIHLENELLNLQNTSKTAQSLDDESLQDSIQDLEQKIASQEKQKNLLQRQSSIYALTQVADSKNLKDFAISQENKQIYLSANGKYENFFGFLENLESQSHLQIRSLCLYPNASMGHLEFYLEILLHRNIETNPPL